MNRLGMPDAGLAADIEGPAECPSLEPMSIKNFLMPSMTDVQGRLSRIRFKEGDPILLQPQSEQFGKL